MKKIWVNKTDTFEAAERFDENYYLSMSRTKRLETIQFLREICSKFLENESRKRLRRVIKIIQ